MKILFFGDIVGKIGRQAVKLILPELKKEFEPDLVLANGENLAHGMGVSRKILEEMTAAGIDFFTSGNHILAKPEAEEILNRKDSLLLRPANYPSSFPGEEFKIVENLGRQILLINLAGRVFMKENFDCPFRKIDDILAKIKNKKLAGIIVDFHAEATSEKAAFGWYVDGRVSAVLGTHTHVPTADAKILPKGTAFISDVGMVGASKSVIGDKIEPILENFLTQAPHRIEIPEEGEVDINAVLLEIDPKTRTAKSLQRVDRKVRV